jgi:hypothetical protein
VVKWYLANRMKIIENYSMGHIKDMTPEQRRDFLAFSYLRNKEARVGNSFAYFNQKKFGTKKKVG